MYLCIDYIFMINLHAAWMLAEAFQWYIIFLHTVVIRYFNFQFAFFVSFTLCIAGWGLKGMSAASDVFIFWKRFSYRPSRRRLIVIRNGKI